MTAQEKKEAVAAIQWFHCFDFGDGVFSTDECAAQVYKGKAEMVFRHPVAGKTVLDIGAWDGYFSFEAERRGAKRVLATDYFCWGGPGWGTKAGFDLAKRIYNSKVEDLEIDVPDISAERVGVWDVVLFTGVLYHTRHPMLLLERVSGVTREMAVIETALDLQEIDRPALSFVRGRTWLGPDGVRRDVPLHNDPTNYFGPNTAAVVAMLEDIGFSRVEQHVTPDLRGFFYAWK